MSDNEENIEDEKPFYIDRAKQGRATCKKCKNKLEKGELRLAKVAPNMFGSGKMKMWHHPACMFEMFMKQRPTTKRLESPDDIDNWDSLDAVDQNDILKRIEEFEKAYAEKTGIKITPKKKTPVKDNTSKTEKASTSKTVKKLKTSSLSQNSVDSDKSIDCNDINKTHKDNLFREFRRLCAEVSNISSYLEKTALVREMFQNGRDGNGFKGDIEQWSRLLLPGAIKRIYNLQSRQLIKLFSRILNTDFDDMLVDLEEGDVAETIAKFFEKSATVQPASKSLLTMDDVDKFLEELSTMTKEDEQTHHLKKMAKKCTVNDLKMIIRLIKHDLRINAGPKHILEGIHADAYEIFQSTRDIKSVLSKVMGNSESIKTPEVAQKVIKAKISLMIPVLPMLAEPCKSIEMAMRKCPNGMYSEIKYDGERVQVHKKGSEFKYFSRSLKPVVAHKVNHFQEFIPQAFPHGKDLILDSEILMIDTVTGKPLPFGTLGIHKKNEMKNANVCLFVFDCIYYNGEILTHKPIMERRKILLENMTQIENHIMFSEMKHIQEPKELATMIIDTFKLNLEGLVLKDLCSIYEPGKRHWLKVKKDYLFEGAMADSADLVVLGAWYGTGKKGGMMSVFLMGCYDPSKDIWCTVTKVHTGHDDATLESLQNELDMIKISCDPFKVPDWLKVTKTMIPDFVAKDPKKQPVWEITGAEFTQHEVHTADGISVRFPRVTRIRSDKDWKTATSLPELRDLIKKSKETMDDTLIKNLEEYVKNNNLNASIESAGKSPKKKENTSKRKKNSDNKKTQKTNLFDLLPNLKHSVKNEDSKESVKKFKKEIDFDDKSNENNDKEDEQIVRDSDYDDVDMKLEDNTEYQTSEKSKDLKHLNSSNIYYLNNKSCVSKTLLNNSSFPDIFLGVKLLILPDVNTINSKLIRYFIAYGGVVISNDQLEEATHVIHSTNSVPVEEKFKYKSSVRHITENWLSESIKAQEFQNIQAYPVFLE